VVSFVRLSGFGQCLNARYTHVYHITVPVQHVSESFRSLVPAIIITRHLLASCTPRLTARTCLFVNWNSSETIIGEILATPMTHVCQYKNQTPA